MELGEFGSLPYERFFADGLSKLVFPKQFQIRGNEDERQKERDDQVGEKGREVVHGGMLCAKGFFSAQVYPPGEYCKAESVFTCARSLIRYTFHTFIPINDIHGGMQLGTAMRIQNVRQRRRLSEVTGRHS
jgi:hypothetical protein